jgi:anthranilate phosphoribosyltransferase
VLYPRNLHRMEMRDILTAVMAGGHLCRDDAATMMRQLMTGQTPPAQAAALLVALRIKGETIDEITGFAETMRALATPIRTVRRPLVDTCGTGGDHSGTFNISTAAAFVVAGAGVAVAKHGNRSATSFCGSADVLEALDVNILAGPGHVGRSIDEIGIGFLFARSLHGAMKHVAPVRAELGVRTVFNILGPLTNPASAGGQVMGIFDGKLAEPIAQVLLHLGVDHAFVVHGSDGLDEITLTGPTMLAEAKNGEVSVTEIHPEDYGLATAAPEALRGGDSEKNAAILRAVLAGETGPHRDVVLLNAAPAIVAGRGAETIAEGIERARESIDSGAARHKLSELIRISHDTG